MATVILKNLVTGETSGGVFTLTSITNANYPTTIYDVNLGSNVTFNSAADLPYSFTAGTPYDAIITTLSTTKAGTYNIEYCVSNCGNIECSSSSITMVEKPIMGSTPTIYRCGINGVYGSVTACYLGSITKTSDGTPYTDPLTNLSWTALTGLWTGSGNCVTIPNTVPETAILIQTQSVTGSCSTNTTVNLVNKNIFAGNTQTKKLCLDKHQIEVYKNTPGGGADIALINLDTNLFIGTGEIVPSGATKVWSFISGPTTVPFTTTNIVDFKNASTGSYVFRKTVTYGSCTHTTDYTAIVKFCTVGDQVTKVSTACKLNSVITMNTAYAALINPAYNPVSSAGCWTYVGSPTGATLNLEINGVPYTNYNTLDDFPYNATVKITSVGKYEFQFDTGNGGGGGGTNPGGCVAVDMNVVCDCDFFASYNSSGTFVIDTNPGVPFLGSSKTYNTGCGTRQVSLLTKFTQLNTPFPAGESGIAGGGTWTLDFVSGSPGLPFTCLVNGVSTTFTSIGQTVGVGDPLIDLSGLPNPSSYAFKYTVTGACGSNNKNLTVNVNCNECTKIINTVAPTTNCVSTLSLVKPISFISNKYSLETTNNQKEVSGKILARITDCDGDVVDTPINARGNTLVYALKVGNLVSGTYRYPKGSYLKSITLESNTLGVKTLNLDPNSSPYLAASACGTAINASDLCYSHETRIVYAEQLKKLIKKAICAEFGGATQGPNYDLKQVVVNTNLSLDNGFVFIEFYAKHNPTGQWISLNTSTANATWSKGINVCPSPNNHQTEFNISKYEIPSQIDWLASGNNYCGNLKQIITGYGIPGIINVSTSTPFSIQLLITETPVVFVPSTQDVTSLTCKKWNFSTTISPACSGAATYSYKVNGVAIPETTVTFVKKTTLAENNPFNPCGTGSQPFETTVVCDGCTYVKNTLNFNC